MFDLYVCIGGEVTSVDYIKGIKISKVFLQSSTECFEFVVSERAGWFKSKPRVAGCIIRKMKVGWILDCRYITLRLE